MATSLSLSEQQLTFPSKKAAMKSNDLFRTLTTVTTGRPPFQKSNDIEVDDTAPLPLFIGIGLPVFIGFIILVLICCFCRRRRGAGARAQANQAANTNYHRAPEADGIGAGAYPMTAVTNSYAGYPPGQPVGPSHYTPVPPGVRPPMHPAYPPQQVPPPAAAHFAALQPYPPQYIPMAPPPAPAHQSHSSQASSVSGHTADPLVSSSSPSVPSVGAPPLHIMQQHQQQQQQQQYLQQQYQQQQQQYQQQIQHQKELFHQQQQLQFHHQPPPPSGLSRESPAPFQYAPSPYMMMTTTQGPDHSAVITPTSTVSQTQLPSPTKSKSPIGQTATSPVKDDGTDQDLGYSEGEE